MIMAPPAISETAYEAPLPVAINSAPDLCAYVPCAEVSRRNQLFRAHGQAAYVEAYRFEGSEKKLAGYVLLSTDITDIPAYSGKPVITLIGMDTKGIFTGKILKHSEPILLLGIPESVLTKFNKQYLGKFVGDKIEIGRSRRDNEGYIGLDAISGATVTVIAQNQVMMTSGVAIARQVGILEGRAQATNRAFPPSTSGSAGQQLVEQGSVRRLTVRPEQVGKPRAPEPHIDMHGSAI
jgi:NosR/NirI family nitrous oxide reductase transcriptional regulator